MECYMCKYWSQKEYKEDWKLDEFYWIGWCSKHKEEYPEGSICDEFELSSK